MKLILPWHLTLTGFAPDQNAGLADKVQRVAFPEDHAMVVLPPVYVRFPGVTESRAVGRRRDSANASRPLLAEERSKTARGSFTVWVEATGASEARLAARGGRSPRTPLAHAGAAASRPAMTATRTMTPRPTREASASDTGALRVTAHQALRGAYSRFATDFHDLLEVRHDRPVARTPLRIFKSCSNLRVPSGFALSRTGALSRRSVSAGMLSASSFGSRPSVLARALS